MVVVFFSPDWFLVPAVGLMKDLGHGQDDNPLGQSWQLPEGLAVNTKRGAEYGSPKIYHFGIWIILH